MELKKEVEELYNQMEIYWKQRSRALWLNHGDRNTKFFHRTATVRRNKNRIISLIDERGYEVRSSYDIAGMVKRYFGQMFKAKVYEWSHVVSFIQENVTVDMNARLTAPFTEAEVKAAVFGMHPDKSLGLDGMNPHFFQEYWDIIGQSVTEACLHWIQNGTIPKEVNETLIILIPKKKSPKKLDEYRPISLCNVLYKILSKMLASRLKCILPRIILNNRVLLLGGD